jgi:hypothetical protein
MDEKICVDRELQVYPGIYFYFIVMCLSKIIRELKRRLKSTVISRLEMAVQLHPLYYSCNHCILQMFYYQTTSSPQCAIWLQGLFIRKIIHLQCEHQHLGEMFYISIMKQAIQVSKLTFLRLCSF